MISLAWLSFHFCRVSTVPSSFHCYNFNPAALVKVNPKVYSPSPLTSPSTYHQEMGLLYSLVLSKQLETLKGPLFHAFRGQKVVEV